MLRCVELRVLVVFWYSGFELLVVIYGFLNLVIACFIESFNRKWTIWFIDFLRLDLYDACVTLSLSLSIYIYIYIIFCRHALMMLKYKYLVNFRD